MLKYTFQSDFLIDGDYLIRKNDIQPSNQSDFMLLNTLSKICTKKIGPSFNIHFSGVQKLIDTEINSAI